MKMINRKKVEALLAAGAIAITAVLAGCGGAAPSASSAAGGGNGKKVVVVAHTNAYYPYDFVNDKGQSDGFEVAVMKEVAKKLPQYEFKYVPTSDDDLLIGVESGKYTLGTKGIWITEARKKKYVFPKNNIAASVIGLAIRKDTADQIKDMDSFAAYSGKLVPIAPQNAQYAVIDDYNKNHPDHQVQLTASENFQVVDAYTWVMEGRYDGYLDIELSFKKNVTDADGPYHQFADRLSYVRYKAIPTYPIFNKKEQKLADEYDQAIEQLRQEGKIKELEEKYFGEELSQYLEKGSHT
jgi:L-cystine transport system substrate-binding protein